MNLNLIIFLALFGYILYIKAIRPIVINVKHKKDKHGIVLPESFDNITLMKYLQDKGFTYPEFKNMRHNELGQVVIEGKYSTHALEIKDNVLYVGRGEKGGDSKKANCILEAVIIGHYLSKLFNPNARVDAYKEFVTFKKRRKQPFIVSTLLIGIFIIAFAFMSKDELAPLIPEMNSNSISSSYLTQYSSTVTVGTAFNDFFGDPKWKSYEQGIQKYVDFQGEVTLDNEPAVAVITFSLLGDSFKVESVKIDNDSLNPTEVESFFQTVYE